MLTEERLAALKPLFEDAAFAEELKKAETAADLQAAFAARGVPVSEDELDEIAKMADTEGELDEANLDDVAGGVLRPIGIGPVPSIVSKVIVKKVVKKVAKKISSLFK